jgi:hypothetical protein
MPETLDSVRASARRVLELLADGKRILVIAPISKLSMRAFRDVLDLAAASDDPRDIVGHFAEREIRSGEGLAEFYAERDLELGVMARLVPYDAAWAPFGVMTDTRDVVSQALKPKNGAWI